MTAEINENGDEKGAIQAKEAPEQVEEEGGGQVEEQIGRQDDDEDNEEATN